MKMSSLFITIAIIGLLFSCDGNNDGKYSYNGRVDTDIIRLSAQVEGIIDTLTVDEGHQIEKGQLLAAINTDKIKAQLKQQKAQNDELSANLSLLDSQVKQVKSQLSLARETLEKTEKMVSDGAATTQKCDELATQVDVLQAQLEGLFTNRSVINSKREQLAATIELTQIKLRDAKIIAPVNGIVINRFLQVYELVNPGRVILEIADLSNMEASIYVPLAEINRIKIGQEVEIRVDGYEEEITGNIKWISSQSEFTPKTILTKETRTTLVYAVKVEILNPDGILKIGMPIDVVF